MPAIAVKVAEAIAGELRAATFTLCPDVIRGYVVSKDLELPAAEDLRIDVQAGEETTEALSREDMVWTCLTDIAVRKRFVDEESDDDTGIIDVAEIDRMYLLVEQIHDHFARDSEGFPGRRLTEYAAATVEDVAFVPSISKRSLRDFRQFTGIVQVTCRVIV